MAEQNVAALLAALAGRSAVNPSAQPQQQQQQPAQLSQASMASLAQTLAANPNLGGLAQLAQNPQALSALQQFSVPQPTTSGSLDISKILPSSSGSVSIADAVARVKSRAAELGLQSGGPSRYDDPRLNRRRSGSRSRSPPPRDRFRGDYDRRDERRGRGYDRDRSFSPPPRRGPYSPPPNRHERGGGGVGGGRYRDRDPDVTMHQMQVDSSLVGLIIGRGGETLRRVEQETGCKVQFLTGAEYRDLQDRPCNITGTPAQIAQAKKQIQQIIAENAKPGPPPPKRGGGGGYSNQQQQQQHQGGASPSPYPQLRDGEESLQIMVPDRTVGLIIGRHGETIRDLQERSGCHINIVGEAKSVNGLRPVNLIGSGDSAKRAKDLIMEIVDSDIRSQASGGPPPGVRLPGGGPSGYYGSAGPSGEKAVQTMKVPIEAVGMIIGRGGDTIKEMQATTGCRINVSSNFNPGDVEREITLQGTADAIEKARAAITEKVNSSGQKKPQGGNRNDYDNQYNSGYRSPPQHGQHHGSNSQQQQQSQPAAAAANAADPYAPWGGYEAYAQMYYAMMAQQQAAAQQAGAGPNDQGGAPGTS